MLTNSQTLAQLGSAGGQVQENFDTRPTLNRFRRLGLYYVLRANGHDVSEDMPHQKLLNYAKAYEDDLDFSKVQINIDASDSYVVRKPDCCKQVERDFDEEVQDKRSDLSDLSRQELIKLASQKGVADAFKKKNVELVEELSLLGDE